MLRYLILFIVINLISCTDATISDFSSFGDEADVICYSGGKEIFKDRSTGKVQMLDGGGWHFRNKDGNYIRTFADCFVVVK